MKHASTSSSCFPLARLPDEGVASIVVVTSPEDGSLIAVRERLRKRGRLRWLAEFLHRDLDTELRAGELQDLADDVAAFAHPLAVRPATALRQVELSALQAVLRVGLKELWTKGSWLVARSPAYKEASDEHVYVMLELERDSEADHPNALGSLTLPRPVKLRFELTSRSPNFMRSFVIEAARVIEAAPNKKIRRCAWCGEVFIRVHRELYHSTACATRARNATRPGRQKEPPVVASLKAERRPRRGSKRGAGR